ncbi:MAG: hypothetical protein MJA82_07605 [Clostridia bacterium]|nr:hypothetical protein [Clostridia bacterium]
MPIRPIDMQVLIPKSQNISKMSQDMANKGENILQQSLNKDKKIEEEKLKKVNTTDKKEGALVNSNDKNKSLQGSEKKMGDKSNKSSNSSSSKIDIKI